MRRPPRVQICVPGQEGRNEVAKTAPSKPQLINADRIKGDDDMKCEVCNRLERLFLESMIYADKAETALRCYLITHQWAASVSDMDEYNALRAEQERTADERHRSYTDLVIHAMSESGSTSGREEMAPRRDRVS